MHPSGLPLPKGAAPAHRWTKANTDWVPCTTLWNGKVIADPLKLLSKEAEVLHQVRFHRQLQHKHDISLHLAASDRSKS